MGLVVFLNLVESNYFFKHVDNYFQSTIQRRRRTSQMIDK